MDDHARDVFLSELKKQFPEGYKQKFNKQYQTNSNPCDLVIYFGLHPVTELGDHFDSRLQENIEWIQGRKHSTAFRKVWNRKGVKSCNIYLKRVF